MTHKHTQPLSCKSKREKGPISMQCNGKCTFYIHFYVWQKREQRVRRRNILFLSTQYNKQIRWINNSRLLYGLWNISHQNSNLETIWIVWAFLRLINTFYGDFNFLMLSQKVKSRNQIFELCTFNNN